MKKIILIIMLVLIKSNAFASTAIYYSQTLNLIFLKRRQPNEAIAIQKAKSACEAEADDCELITSAENAAYVAIAAHKKKGVFVTTGASSKKEAETRALNNCNSELGNCKIYSSFFDPIYTPPPPTAQCYGRYGATAQCGALYDDSNRHVITGKPLIDFNGPY